jgi:hypothetical protein
LPDDTEVAELITMLVRFRTQAVAAVETTHHLRGRTTYPKLPAYAATTTLSLGWVAGGGRTLRLPQIPA